MAAGVYHPVMTLPISLTSLEEALAALLAAANPVPPRSLPLAEAVGRVLAVDAVAPAAVPPIAVAGRDGFAVAAADTFGASPASPLPLMPPPAALRAGEAMPPGTDAVLWPFDLVEAGAFAEAVQAVAPGEGVREAGADIPAGAVLARAGTRLLARHLPALEAAGCAEVAVRIPRVALAGVPPFLAHLVREEGAEPVAGDEADLLLLAEAPGLRRGIAMRPGMEAGFGLVGGRPAVLVPPAPEDAMAVWLMLARTVLRALSGRSVAPQRVRLPRKLTSAPGMAELVALRLAPVEILSVGVLPLSALAAMEGWLALPAASEGAPAGAEREVLDP